MIYTLHYRLHLDSLTQSLALGSEFDTEWRIELTHSLKMKQLLTLIHSLIQSVTVHFIVTARLNDSVISGQ